jgi:hypothetical protein
MGRLFQPLLFFLARCSRNELIRQIEFLKAVNEILRKRIPQQKITLNHGKRARLLRLGKAVPGPFPDLRREALRLSGAGIRRALSH